MKQYEFDSNASHCIICIPLQNMQVHVAEGRVHTSETVDACSMRPCVCQMRDDESNEVGASSMENIDYEASHFVR